MLRHHLVWDDQRHGTGIAAIDEEHQRIIALINQINDHIGRDHALDNAWEVMDELVAFTGNHFAHEEMIMALNEYPDTEAHIAEHQKLLDQLGNLIEKAQHTPSQMRASLVTAFLADWAEIHIFNDDRKLGEFLTASEKSIQIS